MLRSLLVGLLTGAVLGVPSPAGAAPAGPDQTHPEWGYTTGHDARIRRGCHGYRYDYAVTPPPGYWSLETFLVGPDGTTYGSGYFQTGADPLSGSGAFRLCRRSTKAGRYTIRAYVSVEGEHGERDGGWLPDSRFRLRSRR